MLRNGFSELRGDKGDVRKETSKKRKLSTRSKMHAAEGIYLACIARRGVINAVRTIVAKNGKRAKSRIVLPGGSARVSRSVGACVRECEVALKNRDKVAGAKRAAVKRGDSGGIRRGSRRRRVR